MRGKFAVNVNMTAAVYAQKVEWIVIQRFGLGLLKNE
jgi:hypothetical protein